MFSQAVHIYGFGSGKVRLETTTDRDSIDLIVQVHHPGELGDPPEDMYFPLELPRVDVLAVSRDVPPAGEHQARAR
jgi:hypothetical protein